MGAAGDLVGGRFHYPIGWQKLCRSQTIAQLRWVRARRLARRGKINGIVPGGDSAGECEDRFHPGRKFRSDHSQGGVGLAFGHFCDAAFGVEVISERALVSSFTSKSRRQPHSGSPGRIYDFDARGHFKRAPTIWHGAFREQVCRPWEREACRRNASGTQEISTVHRSVLWIRNFDPIANADNPIMTLLASRRVNFADMEQSTSIGF